MNTAYQLAARLPKGAPPGSLERTQHPNYGQKATFIRRAASIILLALFAVTPVACASGGSRDGSAATAGDAVTGALQGEITVTCYNTMYYSKYLTEAAGLFESAHPGTKINIAYFSQMPEYIPTEGGGSLIVLPDADPPAEVDYISRVSAQMMSDRGPDILAMDVLPYYKYADGGFLEDLRGYMEADADFNAGLYRSNIIEAMRYKGGQYVMPLDFGYMFMAFDPEVVDAATVSKLRTKDTWTWQELVGLIREQYAADDSDARAFNFTESAPDAFRRLLYPNDYDLFVDLENRKAHFDDGRFARLLDELEALRRDDYFRPEFSSEDELIQDILYSTRDYYYRFDIDMSVKYWFVDRGPGTVRDPGRDAFAGLVANDAGQVLVRNYQSYGINANSKNKALAWAFLKCLLGDEMQQSYNLLGLPVNNAAFLEKAKVNLTLQPNMIVLEEGGYGVDGYQDVTDEKTLQAYEDYLAFQEEIIPCLNHYPIVDRIITDMVDKETALFFDGTKSEQEVADTLQRRVQLYLDE